VGKSKGVQIKELEETKLSLADTVKFERNSKLLEVVFGSSHTRFSY
jgi:hypothetical protein